MRNNLSLFLTYEFVKRETQTTYKNKMGDCSTKRTNLPVKDRVLIDRSYGDCSSNKVFFYVSKGYAHGSAIGPKLLK